MRLLEIRSWEIGLIADWKTLTYSFQSCVVMLMVYRTGHRCPVDHNRWCDRLRERT